MTTEGKKEGFDKLSEARQMRDSWLREKITVDLGYYVQSAELQRGLVALQNLISAIDNRIGEVLPEYWGYSPLHRKITVFKGFVCDYASIPRILWVIFARQEIRRPAVLHDALYRILRLLYRRGLINRKQKRHFRKLADDLFREAMEYCEPEVPGWKQWSAYRSVRAFGWIDWKQAKDTATKPFRKNKFRRGPRRGPKHHR